MKCFFTRVSAFLFSLIPAITLAGWQVSNPHASSSPNQPFFQAGVPQRSNAAPIPVSGYNAESFPNQFANLGRPAAIYAISVSGSLKENVERIMDRYHWRVVWKAPYDYNFDGRVTGSSLPNVIERLFKPFPLQAEMFISNRTMVVTQRKV